MSLLLLLINFMCHLWIKEPYFWCEHKQWRPYLHLTSKMNLQIIQHRSKLHHVERWHKSFWKKIVFVVCQLISNPLPSLCACGSLWTLVCPCLCICICLCDIPELVQAIVSECYPSLEWATPPQAYTSVIITQNSSLPLQIWQSMPFGDAPTRAMEIKLTEKPWWRQSLAG